MNSKH